MLIVTLIARPWKQWKCPSTGEQIDKLPLWHFSPLPSLVQSPLSPGIHYLPKKGLIVKFQLLQAFFLWIVNSTSSVFAVLDGFTGTLSRTALWQGGKVLDLGCPGFPRKGGSLPSIRPEGEEWEQDSHIPHWAAGAFLRGTCNWTHIKIQELIHDKNFYLVYQRNAYSPISINLTLWEW